MNKSTVYVVQDMGNKDFSPALAFGELEVLLSRDLPVFGDATDVVQKLESRLVAFNPLADFVLPTGDPLAIGAIYGVLAKLGCPYVQSLKWDRLSRSYRPVKVPFPTTKLRGPNP